MKIIIVGCGKVGAALTAQLSREDNLVTVIDTDSIVVRNVSNTYDVMGIVGNGASYQVLQEADIEHADLMIAVTDKDELNMLLGEFPIKKEGSQGQNKTYLVALKLAQFDFLKRTGRTVPLLLLDDIFDKLDASRVEQIVKLVGGDNFGQIFITDTNRGHLDRILHKVGSDYKIFRVEEGTIQEMEADDEAQ